MSQAEPITAAPAVRILETARLRLAEGGFGDLTLRPLAEASGSTVAALTYHFGSKGQLIERLVCQERQADADRNAEFTARYVALPKLTPPGLAALVEAYLDEASGPARVTSMIWSELLLQAAADPEARALAAPWIDDRRAFWRDLLEHRIDAPETWAAVVLGYVTDETIHSLAQGQDPDYRLLRRMGVERLTTRGAGRDLSHPDLFDAVVRRLDPALALPGASSPDEPFSPRAQIIALAAGEVIVAQGAEAVTHRAVGERAQTPASSVAYHFRTRLDLLRAGLTVIYRVAQGRLAPRPDQAELEGFVARGTASVALAAARAPELAPFAADLRRLRGENLRRRLVERLGERSDIDLCMAQAASIARLGATLIALAADEPRENVDGLVEWLTARI